MHLSSNMAGMNATKIAIISFGFLLAGILIGFILMPMGLRKMIKSVRIKRKYEILTKKKNPFSCTKKTKKKILSLDIHSK